MSKIFLMAMLTVVAFCQFALVSNAWAEETGPSTDAMHSQLIKITQRSLNPLGYSSPQQVIGVVIRILLAFVGSIAMILYVWAGITLMTAAGAAEKIKKAIDIFIWTSLGVIVMLGSYVIVNFIFSGILQSPATLQY